MAPRRALPNSMRAHRERRSGCHTCGHGDFHWPRTHRCAEGGRRAKSHEGTPFLQRISERAGRWDDGRPRRHPGRCWHDRRRGRRVDPRGRFSGRPHEAVLRQMSAPLGPPPFRRYGDPVPGAPINRRGGRGRTALLFAAAVLIGLLLGVLVGLWFRHRDDPPTIPPVPTTTTTTTVPPATIEASPTTTPPDTTPSVPESGPPTTIGAGSGTSLPLPIPPDTASPLGVPTAGSG